MVELVRRRGVPRWTRGAVGVVAAVTAAVAVGRAHAPRREAPPSAEMLAWRTAPAETSVAFVDPAVVASDDGWVVAWSRWQRGGSPCVQVASLDRDGAVRGEVRTVSAPRSFARDPTIARRGARFGVAWTATFRDDEGWAPRPWLAVVDARATITSPPQAIAPGEEYGYGAHVASDGEGWGVGWLSLSEAHRGFALARLTLDGRLRGPVTHADAPDGGLAGSLAWTGDAWLAPQTSHDFGRDRSALSLHWIDRGGRLLETQRFAPSLGQIGLVNAVARGSSAWLTWGVDGSFEVRHDPRFARFEGRRAVVGPVPLGPRRSGTVAALACAATECLSAWAGVDDQGDEPAALHVQVLDADGAPRGDARRLGPSALLARLGGVGLARSVDEREALAVWTVRDGDDWRLMRVRLGPDGAPLAPPALLPLP